MTGTNIYGLRLTGDREVRYIGRTYLPIKDRLRQHKSSAVNRIDPLAAWLNANHGKVEAFLITHVPEHGDYCAIERQTIVDCLKLGQRLFNRAYVPAEYLTEEAA